ncbi:MAG: SusC/RagA family TonB-linked outer membrane protein [Bacteroidales bacterium]|nr:SusC/RagA family TonB-linked outer membrane protein [Bacteroidales bacterium]
MKRCLLYTKHFTITALALMLSWVSYAQLHKVSGTVVGNDGNPLIGATVIIDGTPQGVTTDIDGNYSISTSPNATLRFEYIGFETITEPVEGRTMINVTLKEKATGLDEVLVIGYAVGNRRSVSGAVERVTAEEMNTGYISSPIDAIRGKVPGLVISQSGGELGTPTMRIRGTSSLSGGSDPLVIIDGVFGNLNMLYELSSQDIDEVTVLKDASETAQYGSRGAAGVIVVTTKKGKEGIARINYNGQFGVSQTFKNIQMLDASSFRNLMSTEFSGAGMDLGESTNWFNWVQNDFVFQNNHNLSLTQGNEKANMRASVGVNQRNGLVRGTNYDTYNFRVNATQMGLKNKLRLEFSAQGTYRESDSKPNVWSSALVYNPTFPSWRNPSTGMWDVDPAAQSMTTHPGELMDTEMETTHTRLTTTGRATYNIIDGLSVGAFGSFKVFNSLYKTYYRNDVTNYAGVRGQANIQNSNSNEWLASVQMNYIKEIGKHSINALGLVEAQSYYIFDNAVTVQGFDTNYFKWNNLQAGSTLDWGNATSNADKNSILSYMLRFNYMYDNKYVITLNARADGSSKLGANHKWGFFPSASAAWVISNESFMKDQTLFSTLKLRAGYGVTGNQNAISPLNSLQLMAPSGLSEYNSKPVVTYAITSNSNPDLQWETKYTFDVGLDISMLKGRLRATADYYRSYTKDMLYTYAVSVPPFTYTTLLANLGEMTNNGFELSVSADVIKSKDWKLTLAGNVAYNKNKLISLEGTYRGEEFTTAKWINVTSQGGAGMVGNTGVTYMAQGYPVGIFRLPVHDGFDEDSQGHLTYKFKDLDGSGSIDLGDDGDRAIVGQVVPKVNASLSIRLNYKKFDLAVQMNGAFRHHIYNFSSMALSNLNNFPLYNVMAEAPQRNIYDIKHTTYWLERGDYVHIEYITLGYNVLTRNAGLISDIRLALSCNNVATFTGYTGLTPLINSANFTSGIDARNVTPLQRTFTLMLQVNF